MGASALDRPTVHSVTLGISWCLGLITLSEKPGFFCFFVFKEYGLLKARKPVGGDSWGILNGGKLIYREFSVGSVVRTLWFHYWGAPVWVRLLVQEPRSCRALNMAKQKLKKMKILSYKTNLSQHRTLTWVIIHFLSVSQTTTAPCKMFRAQQWSRR